MKLAEDLRPERVELDFGGQARGPRYEFFESALYGRQDKRAFKASGFVFGYYKINGRTIPGWLR